MSAFSDFLEASLLNHTLRNVAYTSPTSVFVALFNSATTDTVTTGGTGQGEVSTSGTAYTREAVTFAAPSGGQVVNTADITFSTATASWGTVTHVAIFDNVTVGSGNCLYHGPLATPKTVNTSDTFRFLASQLIVGLN